MAFSEPTMLHQFLGKLADHVYVRYQIDAVRKLCNCLTLGRATQSRDFKMFALPTNNELWNRSRQRTPTRPFLYINGSAGILELMAHSGVDIVSVDWTVDMAVARQRLGANMGARKYRPVCCLVTKRLSARASSTLSEKPGTRDIS